MEPKMGNTKEASPSKNVSTRLNRIAELARKMPGAELRTLAHHIDMDMLLVAYARTRKDGAAGIDEVTAEEYERNLKATLTRVRDEFKSGTYWAPPVRRADIEKTDGGKRPLGIPTVQEQGLQGAGAQVLSAV